MGSTASSLMDDTDSHRHHTLALLAVANSMTLTQQQLLSLRKHCTFGSLGQKRTRENVSRASFQKAMSRAKISLQTNDWDIIEQLYTMWDDDGDERLEYREFLAGISPLACGDMSLAQVLSFAFKVYDTHATSISHYDLKTVLNGINATAAYFGDHVLSKQQVQVMVDSVFLSLEPNSKGQLSHEDCVEMLTTHPMVEQFVLGLGQYKYVARYHSMQKDDQHFHEEHQGRVIVGDDANGTILSTDSTEQEI